MTGFNWVFKESEIYSQFYGYQVCLDVELYLIKAAFDSLKL